MNTEWKDKIITYFIEHGGKVIGALAILIAGFMISRWLGKILAGWLEKKGLEPPVRMLVCKIVKLLVLAFALMIALGTLQINILPLVAGLGVAGVGISLAMQGVLANLVAGLVIIFTKPFRVGEYVAMVGVEGQVHTIELFSTTLLHTDRSRVVVPNRKIVGEILHNYGNLRQLDLIVGVAYHTDLNQALAAVRDVLARNTRVLRDVAPVVGVSLLADSSINIAVKPWVAVNDYVPAHTEIYQAIVESFRQLRVEIPFPQREVRMLGGAAA